MKFKLKKRQKRLLTRNVGNVLMLIPVIILLYIYYPLLFIYIAPPQIQPIPKTQKGIFIEIPKIQAQAPIIENVDPWNEATYQKALQKGVAHALGSSPVGSSSGTIYLFAHSSEAPWAITRLNTAFFKLGSLKINDEIKLIKDGKAYVYIVTDKKTVWPNETNYLKDFNKNQLILQTCTPIGTALQRLLIFAKPKI